jgi:DNA-binding transcriptional regulator YiaG
MSNHPNRSRAKSPASNPNPDQILGCRINSGLTQSNAAATIYCSLRTWQQWEAGDRRMHPAFFELFLKKTGQID